MSAAVMTHILWWACLFALLQASTGELLIAQVLEGSSYNKALTLSNRGNTTLNLQDYSLSIAYNGMEWRSVITPVGNVQLQPDETFTLCHTKISKLAEPLCDRFTTRINFNGNDAIGLERKGTLIDVFGEVSEKNAKMKGFSVANLPNASLDHTNVRISSITVGTTDWKSSSATQWEVFPEDSFVDGGGDVINLSEMGQAEKDETGKDPKTPGSDEGRVSLENHAQIVQLG